MSPRSALQAALAGTYAIESELSGGMSRVFVAEETKLGRKVVIKVLSRDVTGAISGERFAREIQVAARLQHPHIVPLLTAGEAAGMAYYTMPFVVGETLRDRLARERKLPPADAIHLAIEIADALGHAHAQGVVHRDIKPENILLAGGHALVADFGIAKAIDASKTATDDRITNVGLTVGTPAYMSPEQAAGESNIDARSDVYSLGVMLYEMLSGMQPFTGPTPAAVLAKRFSEIPAGLRTLDGAISIGLDRAVQRAMERDPADRFTSAAAFLEALKDPSAAGLDTEAGPTDGKSIAVLPFSNMSGDQDAEYFSDGMAEEIINALAQLPGLRVAARTSSFAFKGQNLGIAELGARLKVGTVLEGSVRRSGKRLRINAQLINVADGYHIWTDRYDQDFEDVFEIQDKIARAIAGELKVKLGGGERTVIVKPGTSNMEAYDLYLRGRYFWEKRGAHLMTAVEYFTKATKVDPNFALPYAGLADADAALSVYGYIASAEACPRARGTAYRALALDDTLAESHTSVALFESWMGLDLPASERHFRRAIEIKPSWGVPHVYLAQLNAIFGNDDEALAGLLRACEAEPLSPLINAISSIQCSFIRRGEEAVRFAERAIELEPTFPTSYWAAGWAYEVMGRQADALRTIERGVDLSGGGPFFRRLLATHYALAGRSADARAIEKEMGEADTCLGSQARTAWALGDEDRSIALLAKAAEHHDAGFCLFARAPGFDRLEADARWHALLRNIGQPEVAEAYEARTRRRAAVA